jgi:anti-sigma-K factor RskA
VDHAELREMLSVGDRSAEADAHLRTCADCRRWADALARVRAAAPTLVAPPVPAGLADRALAAARGRGSRATPDALPPASPPWWRRVGGRAALAAGLAAAVVVGALAIPSRERPGPRALLMAAAADTAAAKTARVRFSGRMDARLDLDAVALPDLAAEAQRQLEALPPDLRTRVEALLGQLREDARSVVPDALSLEMAVEGTGEAVFPDALHLRGTVTPADARPLGGDFELIVIGERAWIKARATGDRWARMPAAESPFRLTMRPGEVLDLMRVGGPVEDLGEGTLDGDRVHRFRIRQVHEQQRDGAGVAVISTVDVWIGASDRVLRKAEISSEGELATPLGVARFRARGTMQLYDLGADVSVSEPDEAIDGADLFRNGAFALGIGDGGVSFSVAIAASGPALGPRDGCSPTQDHRRHWCEAYRSSVDPRTTNGLPSLPATPSWLSRSARP